MSAFDFDRYFSTLTVDVKALAATEWEDYSRAAIADGNAFLRSSRQDLEQWTAQLACRDLTTDEFEFLVKGKADVAEMTALKNQGLAKVRIEHFRNSMINLIVSGVIKVVLS